MIDAVDVMDVDDAIDVDRYRSFVCVDQLFVAVAIVCWVKTINRSGV
jgi:hypothetical protein